MFLFLLPFFLLVGEYIDGRDSSLLVQVQECSDLNKSIFESEYKLVMISHTLCGPCKIAKSELNKLTGEIEIIVLEFGKLKAGNTKSLEYPNLHFIDPNSCYSGNMTDFFPVFELTDSDNKVVWKKRGWKSVILNKIEKIISN